MTREDQIKYAAQIISYGCSDELETALKQDFPELAETEDERVRKWIHNLIGSLGDPQDEDAEKELEEMQPLALAYLEKQKENADSFTDGIIEVRSFQRGLKEGRRLEKQQEQKSDIILKAFENSKTDYSLEEREEASDYSEKVLPTSIACGESEEEYLLHKVIEAAYIAGQKEQKPERINITEMVAKYAATDEYVEGEYKGKPVNCMIRAYEQGIRDTLLKVKEQKPAEWSEEDEAALISILYCISQAIKNVNDENERNSLLNAKSWIQDKLKFHIPSRISHPRPSWKPSEEEVGCLERLIAFKNPEPEDINGCKSLLEQLTKLI